jgi:two-component system nitrate/nitrite response regulator NarL
MLVSFNGPPKMEVLDLDRSGLQCEVAHDPKTKRAATVKILIADKHALFCGAIKKLLEKEPDFQVVGEVRRGAEVKEKLATLRPDVLLLDLNMSSASGLEILRTLEGACRDVLVIVLAADFKNDELVEVLRLGARGILNKDMPSQLLYKSIRAVMSGECWIDRKSVRHLVRALQVVPAPKSGAGSSNDFGLTKRELQILSTIVDGYTNKDIAKKLSISEQTVKHHLTSIFNKVGVPNRLELALFAMNNNLVVEE